MDAPVLTDQYGLTYISSVRTQDATYKTYQERWMIGTDSEREFGKYVLSAQLDDDE